jgi:hypothetical protein
MNTVQDIIEDQRDNTINVINQTNKEIPFEDDSLFYNYELDLKNKINEQRDRYENYKLYIEQYGVKKFSACFIDAHQPGCYIQHFEEFLQNESEELCEKLRLEYNFRENEFKRNFYQEFFHELSKTNILTTICYLHTEISEDVLNRLDKLTTIDNVISKKSTSKK